MNNSLIEVLEAEKGRLLMKLSIVNQAIFAYKMSSLAAGPDFHSETGLNDLREYKENIEAVLLKYQRYNPAFSTRDKILFIIEVEARFLHVREIARIFRLLERDVSLTSVIKKISPALSNLKKLPGSPLISIEVSHSHFNTFWGLKKWLDADGEIKDEFIYNTTELTKLQKESVFNTDQ